MLTVTKWNNRNIIFGNGFVEKGTPAIGKFQDGKIVLQDGRIFPALQELHQNFIYRGVIVKYYPQEHTIEECEYRGNKVLKRERNYRIDPVIQFDLAQIVSKTHYIATVENRKTRIKLWYDPIPHAYEAFISLGTLLVDIPYTFNPIKEISLGSYGSSKELRVSYSGGGYGEKFYVDGVSIGENFFNYYIGQYISEEFKNYLLYKPLDKFGDIIHLFPEYNEWVKILHSSSSWDIDVESIPYEGGYSPTQFRVRPTALRDINNSIAELIKEYKGSFRKDWKEIQL